MPQVKLDNPSGCLDSLFVFSLVWSVGASCDRPSAAKFDAFLRKLLVGQVQAAVERTDVDLGPGLEIRYPEQMYGMALPEVSDTGTAAHCSQADSCAVTAPQRVYGA